MPDRYAQADGVINFYKKEYKTKFNEDPIINRNKVKYLVLEILKDSSITEFKKVVSYYFRTEKEPSLTSLCYEYDTILFDARREVTDSAERLQLREETRKRAEEYAKRYGGLGKKDD